MISFILPVYNEADRLERNVARVKNHLDSLGISYEIIIAEDGSTDGSEGVAARLAKSGDVVHLHHKERLGRGGALKRAGLIAGGEYIIYMDIDLAADVRHIGDMLRHLKRYDIVTGSRYHKGSVAERSLQRLVLSKAYHFMVRLVFPSLRLSDTECGFKGFRRGVFILLNRSVRNSGWSWDLEFLVRARRTNLNIREMPVTWRECRTTRVNIIRDSMSQFLEIFRIKVLTVSLPHSIRSRAKGSSCS